MAVVLPQAPVRATINVFVVQVQLNGTGSGSWQTTSSPQGTSDNKIDCQLTNGAQSGTCLFDYVTAASSISISWTLTPADSSEWCDSETCWTTPGYGAADISTSEVLYGKFNVRYPALTIHKLGDGTGLVTSDPAGINCGSTCANVFKWGSTITITEQPAPGSFIDLGQGPCPAPCPIILDFKNNVTITVTFSKIVATPGPTGTLRPTPSTAPTRGPTPTPTVTAAPGATGGPRPAASPRVQPPGSSQAPGGSAAAPITPGAGPTDTAISGADSAGPATSGSGPSAVSTGSATDLTPVSIAIVIAAIIVTAGLVFVARTARRKTPPSAP